MSAGVDSTPAASAAHSEFAKPIENETEFQPRFDDTLADVGLFMLFLKYASSKHVAEKLLFVKQATLFTHMRRPREEVLEEATRIYWTYVADGASAEVDSLKPEFKAKLETIMWEPSSEDKITNDLFVDGIQDTRIALLPWYSQWLQLEEWKTLNFYRLPPPTVEAALRHPTLRTSFFQFAETTDNNSGETPFNGGLGQNQLMLRFCRDVQLLKQRVFEKRDQPTPPPEDEILHEYSSGVKDIIFRYIFLLDLFVEDSDDKETDVCYLDRAYIEMLNVITRSNFYHDWLNTHSWYDVDYLPMMRSQSYDEHGFMEVPSLIAALSSPQMLHYLSYLVKPSQERSAALAFLLDIIKFMRTYKKSSNSGQSPNGNSGDGSNPPPSSSGDGSGDRGDDEKESENSKKKNADMVADAKKLYTKYLKDEKTGYTIVPHVLRAEIKAIVSGFNTRSKVNRDIFRRCGAYIYENASRTWFRQIVGSYIWVDMEYDNQAPAAFFVKKEFSKELIDGVPIVAPPSIDDIIYNDSIMDSFVQSLTGVVSSTVMPFIEATESFANRSDDSPHPNDKSDGSEDDLEDNAATCNFREVLELLSPMILLFPQAKAFYRAAQKVVVSKRHSTFSKLLFQYPKNAILCDLLRRTYTKWVSDESHWRSESWEPREVACYDPNFGLYCFANYTNAKASDVDRAFFNNSIAPRTAATSRHHHHFSTSTVVSGSISVPNTSVSSSNSSPSGYSTPVAGDISIYTCQPTPLQACGKSHSFQHTRNGLFGVSPEQSAVPGGSPCPSPSTGAPQLPGISSSQSNPPDKESNSRRMARRSLVLDDGIHPPSPTSPIAPKAVEGDSISSYLVELGFPTLQQVLESSFFRRVFIDGFAMKIISEDARKETALLLWKRLDSFFRKFNGICDAELAQRRNELVFEASTILTDKDCCEEINRLYSQAGSSKTVESIEQTLSSEDEVITSSFFRELEILLCKPYFGILEMKLYVEVKRPYV